MPVSAGITDGCVVQVNAVGTYDGQLCVNTFHFLAVAGGAGASVTVQVLLGLFETNVWDESVAGANDGLRSLSIEGYTDVLLTGQIVFGAGSRSRLEQRTPTNPTGGWTTGNPLPSGVSGVIKRYGSLAGPKYQGRFYVPGLTSASVVESVMTAAWDLRASNLCVRLNLNLHFGAGATGMTFQHCLYERGVAPVPAKCQLTHEPTAVARYQRRREVGVGV